MFGLSMSIILGTVFQRILEIRQKAGEGGGRRGQGGKIEGEGEEEKGIKNNQTYHIYISPNECNCYILQTYTNQKREKIK